MPIRESPGKDSNAGLRVGSRKLVWDFPGTSTAKAVGYTERDKNQDQGKEKAPECRGTDGAPRRGGGENEAKEGTW